MSLWFKLYQRLEWMKHVVLMSLFGYHSVCRHRPTCSQYTLEQMQTSGTIVGLWRGLRRVAMCW